MALTDENNMVMPVAPMYSTGGSGMFGNEGWWIILLFILLGNNGWGGFGGAGGFAADGAALYPWMNQSNQMNDGFRDQMINGNITEIRNGVNGLATQLCNGFSGVNATVNSGFANAETAANARQMANMQTAFSGQMAMNQGFNQLGSQFADCCCENRLGIADLKYTVATENCADRTVALQNTRDIIESQTRNTQAILDKLCALELDGVKSQLAQAQRENVGLQNQLNMSTLRESQTAQNAFIAQGLSNEVDALYNRLKNCPVSTVPVYGNQPIFAQSNSCGCGCGCGSF